MTLSISRERLLELLERARGRRIAVIGDAMLDVYLSGDVERISPEAPVPIVRVRERRHALGGAANVAQNVVAVGAHCELVATAGADGGGERLRQLIATMGVMADSLLTVARPTTMKTRILARSQQLVRIDEEDDHDLTSEDAVRLAELVAVAIARADAVILEDYDKGVLTPAIIRHAIELAAARGLPVVVDPKFRHFFDFDGATVFKPNVRELQSALGAGVDIADTQTLLRMVRRLGVRYLLLTLGERGMVLYSGDGELARVPTHAREVYDVVGAGDTVTAYLASMLAAGATIEEAAWIANIAAGIEVGKLGAVAVTPAELVEVASDLCQ
jgi:D-beta-D-heptose 7-phosphate kinase/D-beta-D-heptose 1-phosphate adenosyltransferase